MKFTIEKEFVYTIIEGIKTQHIVSDLIERNETIDFYIGNELFAKALCHGISPVHLVPKGKKVYIYVSEKPYRLSKILLLDFALSNGFSSINDLFTYFKDEYKGYLIAWCDIEIILNKI